MMGEITLEEFQQQSEEPENKPEGSEQEQDPALQAAQRAAREEPKPVEPPEGGDQRSQEEAVDWPEELKGKSDKERLEAYQTLRTAAENMALYFKQQQGQQQPIQQPPAQQQPQVQQTEPLFAEDDDLMSLTPKDLEEKLNKFFEVKSSPLVQDMRTQLLQQQVLGSYNQAKGLPHFEKFHSEIMQLAQQAGVQNLATPMAWKLIHDTVVVNHLDDLIQERVQQVSKSKPAAPFTETGSEVSPSFTPAENESMELSDIERQINEGLGVPLDVAAKMKKIRQSLGG